MADVVNRETRSRMMAGIGARNTQPELVVRRALHKAGFRFRLDDRSLPGRPDIVLRKHRAVIFVHGCFWHRHTGCRYAATPKTRPEFWAEKLGRNVQRDEEARALLRDSGWRVATVWECETRVADEAFVSRLSEWLRSDDGEFETALAGHLAVASHPSP
jgi:DNA mismatch endonuclease (patch repair protein)